MADASDGFHEVASGINGLVDPRLYWERVSTWGSQVGMPPFRFDMPDPLVQEFRSRLRLFAGDNGAHFIDGFMNAAIRQTTTIDTQGEAVVVGYLSTGRLFIEHNRNDITSLQAGDLFVSDYGRRTQMYWHPNYFHYLTIPRKSVEATLGRRVTHLLGNNGIKKIPDEGLAPFLRSQLQMLSRRGRILNVYERAAALTTLADMAMALLQQHFGKTKSDRTHGNPGVFAAAKRYIEQNYHRHDLHVDEIAAALRCSRTQLYRVFSENETAIAEYIRETRLKRSHQILGAHGGADIAAVAYLCGYTDLSAFGKAFRRRFQQSPSERRGLILPPERRPQAGAWNPQPPSAEPADSMRDGTGSP
ncbi:helix-turn-helix domain-containing protein [Inquilinus sp. CA228]|uniref:helix-turn-helix domain-containing protein n=1 Tax=Inquilinus sp. CA228 TaxID=3455609 RepID=UPI003F8D426C